MEGGSPTPKRFELSREQFARDRVQAIRDTIDFVKKERPEIVSFALFGSLVKGNTRPESDIDMYVFIDADSVQEKHPDEQVVVDKKWNFNLDRGEGPRAVTFRWKDFTIPTREGYYEYVVGELTSRVPLTHEQVKHIHPVPVSEEIIDEMLDDISDSYTEYPSGIESSIVYLARQLHEGDAAKEKTANSRIEPNQLLYSMFFLDAGGGLRKYRRHLIERLSSLGGVGEKIWKDLIRSTEAWEQKLGLLEKTSGKRYPRSLVEARLLYGREVGMSKST